MPAYNVAPYVREAIESLQRQTHRHWELLVADDVSTDATRAVIGQIRDDRIRRLDNAQHLGYLRTCNRLFTLARGELVTFQDADDFSEPTRLDKQVRAIARDPGLGLCGTWIALVEEDGRPFAIQEKPVSSEQIAQALPSMNAFCGASVMIRTALLRTVGGYREFFADYSHQDYDWACRATEHSRAVNIPEVLYSYRQRTGTNSKRIDARRSVGFRLTQELAADRRRSGSDALMRGDLDAARALVDELYRPYRADPSLAYREAAGQLLSSKLFADALRAAAQAVRTRPGLLLNHRTFFYCARQWAKRLLSGSSRSTARAYTAL
jgi:GT2 family glycosyltransferase